MTNKDGETMETGILQADIGKQGCDVSPYPRYPGDPGYPLGQPIDSSNGRNLEATRFGVDRRRQLS